MPDTSTYPSLYPAAYPGASSAPSVIQQVAGSAVSDYGTGTTAITTAAGSFLVAFIGWNCVTSGQYVQVPAVSVTDSAGNLWQQAAITRAGAGVTSSTRCAIWVAANALPVTWVSVGLTGFAEAASWLITEVAGLPQNAVLDFSAGVNSTGTGPSLTWIAQQAGIGLAVISAGNAAETVTSPPSGWSALTTAAAGTGVTGNIIFPYLNTGISAGTSTTAATLGTSASYSYALCSLAAAASPPPQPSQNFPLVIVEAAFGAQPGNISASADYLYSSEFIPWTDITTRAIGPAVTGRIKCSRGRQYQLQQQETGTAQIPLSNVDGAFTPTYPGSPYYSTAVNQNMSFQVSTSPWTPQHGASLAQGTAATYASGLNAAARYSALVTCGAAGTPGIVSELVAINPNYPYSASAWLEAGTAWSTGAQAGVNWYTSGRSLISGTFSTATALPAGQWTRYSLTGLTPPGNAAYAQEVVQLAGTPGAGFRFSVAEAALAAGPQTVQTGLVTPVTPVRVTAWWQGRRYPVWQGWAQQWPQEWPDMPQWGFSTLKAADALGPAAAGAMYSALAGEVLIDNPYAYLPCSEQYTINITGVTAANQFIVANGYFSPADANGLPAVNRASGNQVTGTYLDGQGQQANTGIAMNFQGDNGTGTGIAAYQNQVTGQRGPSMLYADPGLTAVASTSAPSGFTIELWFSWGGTTGQSVELLTGFTLPSAFINPVVSGQQNGVGLSALISLGSLTIRAGSGSLTGPVQATQAPQHLVIEIAPGSPPLISAWLNGVSMGASEGTGTFALGAVVLGPGRYSYDCSMSTQYYYAFNYSAGHLAIYPYQLPQARITAHYQAGATGWAGVSASQRFSQILTWAQLGLKRGAWSQAQATGTAEITQIGPAYSLNGQSAAAAVYAVQQSEGGQERVQANGSLIYLERNAGYNLPVSATLSDGTAAAPVVLNNDPGFATGAAGWTASGASVAYSPGNRYGSLGALSVTPSGSGTITSPAFTVSGGSGQVATGFWVNVPSGGTVSCGLAGLGTATVAVSPGAWEFIPATAASGTASSASLFATAGAASFYLAWAGAWNQVPSVPYEAKSSYGFDNTYIYNEVTATQNDGPNQLVTYDNRGTASQQQYYRRSALTFSPNVVSSYDVSDITTWSLDNYQQPSLHVSGVTVSAAPNPLACFSTVLALDEGQAGQVNRNPVGGAPLAELGIVERVQHDIGAGYWQATYQLSPYGPGQAVMCADTAGFDAPGTATALTLAW